MDYRAYIVDDLGHIFGVKEFDAEDDAAAIQKARQYVDGHDVEVWQRDRKVRVLTRPNR